MQPTDARIFRGAALGTLALSPAAVALAGLLRGPAGVVGAVLGLVAVFAFFSVDALVLPRAAGINALPVAMLLYGAKFVAMAFAIAALDGATFLDRPAFGLTVLAGATVWLAAHTIGFTRARFSYIVTERPAP